MTQALNFEQIRANYLRDLQNQNPTAHVHAGSDNHVRATAIAAVGEGQYQHQEWILRQAFADTADSAYLENTLPNMGFTEKLPPLRAVRCVFAARSVQRCLLANKSMWAIRCI